MRPQLFGDARLLKLTEPLRLENEDRPLVLSGLRHRAHPKRGQTLSGLATIQR